MKPILSLFLIALPYFSFSNTMFHIENDSILVSLFMVKHIIKKDTDLLAHISITSNQRRILQIPKGNNMAYIDRGSGFYLIQCQRKAGSKYTDISGNASIDNIPLINFDTLHVNETYKLEIPIRLLYRFTKGQYRIRVLATLSSLNNVADTYSNWFYFDCPANVRIE